LILQSISTAGSALAYYHFVVNYIVHYKSQRIKQSVKWIHAASLLLFSAFLTLIIQQHSIKIIGVIIALGIILLFYFWNGFIKKCFNRISHCIHLLAFLRLRLAFNNPESLSGTRSIFFWHDELDMA
jgi:hypothetical protein